MKIQFTPEYASTHNWSDKCCKNFKHGALSVFEKENNLYNTFTGMRKEEGGNRNKISCITQSSTGIHFNILITISEEWEEWFINKYNIKLCELYYPPFNFKRTGCLCCPFSLDIEHQLEMLKKYDLKTFKKANILWRPVFEEYKDFVYRMKRNLFNLDD